MTQIKNLFLIFTAFAILSCGKDGLNGPDGPKGDQGVKGVDGSAVHSGTGLPTLNLGKSGDFYLDKGTTSLYGPKTDASWGEPLNLKGIQGDAGGKGDDGRDGSAMLSGISAPTASLGSNGDFYFDTENLAFYGPKTGSSWGTLISLKAANDNGIKVVIIPKFKSNGPVRHLYAVFYDTYSRITPTIDYHKYYEDGVILVYFRNPRDPEGIWSNEVDFNDGIFDGYYGDYNEHVLGVRTATIKGEDVRFGRESIIMKADLAVQMNGQSTAEIIQGHVNRLQDDFTGDIKIVLIPGTQVQAMKQQKVDIKDIKSVNRFLNL